MKKLHILGVAISAALCVPMAAQASDGTINFTGVLNDSTCTVTSGSAGTFTVNLPTVAAATLATAGVTAGTTPFSISVGKCSKFTTFTTFFESGPNTDLQTGRLNSTGSADKVQLELLNSNNSTINVAAAPWAQGVTSFFTTGNTGVGTANFAVRYYATGVATPGDVISAVTYSMSYL